MHYRQCLCVPVADLSEKKSKDVRWPIYRTDDDFERAGSKVKKMIKLIQYHLKHPHAPQIDSWNETAGEMDWPEVAAADSASVRRAPKILVFFYFAAMADTLLSVSRFIFNSQIKSLTSYIWNTGIHFTQHQRRMYNGHERAKETHGSDRPMEGFRRYTRLTFFYSGGDWDESE